MKACVRIKFNGKYYRATKGWHCRSKRDCDLFKKGVCDFDGYVRDLPCDPITAAFDRIGGRCGGCFKEVME